ncbi:MAG: hypothetical protein ABIM32_03890 [candidate division WOR-3 bacterium]
MKKVFLASQKIIDIRDINRFGFLPAIIGSFGDSAFIYELQCDNLDKKASSLLKKIAIGWRKNNEIEYVTDNIGDIIDTGKGKVKWIDDIAIPDKNFLMNLLKASPEALKEYLDNNDFARALSAIEVTRRLLNFLSNSLETSVTIPSDELEVDELDIQDTADRIASYFGNIEVVLEAEKNETSHPTFKIASTTKDIETVYQTLISKYRYLRPVIDEVYTIIKSSIENPLENYYFSNNLVPFVKIAKLESIDKLSLTVSHVTLRDELINKIASFIVEAFIRRVPNAKNSKGEPAPWCVFSHKTKKRLSCYKSKEEAKKAIQRMNIFKKKSYVVYHKNGEIKGIFFDPTTTSEVLFKEARLNKFLSYLGRYVASTMEYIPEEVGKAINVFAEKEGELLLDPPDIQFQKTNEILDKISKYLDARGFNYKVSAVVISSKADLEAGIVPDDSVEAGETEQYIVHEVWREGHNAKSPEIDSDTLQVLSSKEILIPNGVFINVSILNDNGEPTYEIGLNDGIGKWR